MTRYIDRLITGALALISGHNIGARELGDYLAGFITQSKSTSFIHM
jgi:hypothetical protein